MRPMFVEYPENSDTFSIDDQWMIGDSLLVKPVTDAGATSVNVYFPPVHNTCNGQTLPWFDLETLQPTLSTDKVQRIQAELAKIPVFVKPGKPFSLINKQFPCFNHHVSIRVHFIKKDACAKIIEVDVL